MNIIITLLLFLYPFTLLIDTFIPITINGISIMNILYMIIYTVMLCCVFYKIFLVKVSFSKNFLYISLLVLSFYLFLFIKLLDIGGQSFEWIIDNNYYFAMPIVGCYIYFYPPQIKRVLANILLSSTSVALIGLFFFFTKNYYGLVEQETILNYAIVGSNYSRLMATFGNPNVAAYYFVFTLIFTFIYYKSEFYKFNKVLFVLYFSIIVISFILTLSRSAYISLLIIILFYGARELLLGKVKKIFFITLISIIFTLIILMFNLNNLYFFSVEYFINDPRLSKWNAGLTFFYNAILIGTPLNIDISLGTWSTTFADNEFLKNIIYFGIIGFLPLLLILFHIIYLNIKLLKMNYKSNNIIPYFTIVFIYACFFNNFLEFFPVNIYFLILFLVNKRSETQVFKEAYK